MFTYGPSCSQICIGFRRRHTEKGEGVPLDQIYNVKGEVN